MSESNFKEYIKTGNLDILDVNKLSPLIYALKNNKDCNLNLSTEQFDILIEKSSLNIKDKYAWKPLAYAIANNESQKLNLSTEHWDKLLKILDYFNDQETIRFTVTLLAQEVFINGFNKLSIEQLLYAFSPKNLKLFETKENTTTEELHPSNQVIEKAKEFYEINKNYKTLNISVNSKQHIEKIKVKQHKI